MNVIVNGESRELASGISVADLVRESGFNPLYVAVEVNLEIVPREQHAQVKLREGDRVELVTLVGGG